MLNRIVMVPLSVWPRRLVCWSDVGCGGMWGNRRQLGDGVVSGCQEASVPGGMSRCLSRVERSAETIECMCLAHDVKVSRLFSNAGGFVYWVLRPRRSSWATP